MIAPFAASVDVRFALGLGPSHVGVAVRHPVLRQPVFKGRGGRRMLAVMWEIMGYEIRDEFRDDF